MPSHKAILTGHNWNSEPTLVPQRMPLFLTYSFNPGWDGKRFNAADQKLARYALKQWGDACGTRFLETKSSDAEIKFSWYTGFYSSLVAYAEFPEFTPLSVMSREGPGPRRRGWERPLQYRVQIRFEEPFLQDLCPAS